MLGHMALSDLQTALNAKANALTDTVQKELCLNYISRLISVKTAIATLEADQIQSYSRNGFSVTRRQIDEMARKEASLERQISQILYSSISIADMSAEGGNG